MKKIWAALLAPAHYRLDPGWNIRNGHERDELQVGRPGRARFNRARIRAKSLEHGPFRLRAREHHSISFARKMP